MRASPDAWLNFLGCWLKDGDGMLDGVDGFRRILKRLGSICLQTLSGQRHLLEFVLMCRNTLHALRILELRVCDVLGQPKSKPAAKLPMCSPALQSTSCCPKLNPHSTLESSLLSPSTPHRPDDDLLQRSQRRTFQKRSKKTTWCNTDASDEALHCLSDAGGFLTALRCLSPTLRDRESN